MVGDNNLCFNTIIWVFDYQTLPGKEGEMSLIRSNFTYHMVTIEDLQFKT